MKAGQRREPAFYVLFLFSSGKRCQVIDFAYLSRFVLFLFAATAADWPGKRAMTAIRIACHAPQNRSRAEATEEASTA
jgi:hypothetical protein